MAVSVTGSRKKAQNVLSYYNPDATYRERDNRENRRRGGAPESGAAYQRDGIVHFSPETSATRCRDVAEDPAYDRDIQRHPAIPAVRRRRRRGENERLLNYNAPLDTIGGP